MITPGPFSRITAVGTALPSLKVTQQEAFAAFSRFRALSHKEKILYERFLADESIETRFVASDSLDRLFHETPDDAHARFSKHAVTLACEALEAACLQANLRPERLDGLVVTTCTGYLCPGLSSYLMEKLSFKEGAQALDLVGHGCAAALPALRSADAMIRAGGLKHVAVVSVEICTAAIYFGDETDLILSNSIFGDGAAACIVSGDQDAPGLRLERVEGVVWPQYRDDLRFTQREGRLCNKLSKRVPAIVAEAVGNLHALLLPEGEARQYAFHAGGKRILDAIESYLELESAALSLSRASLRCYGNVSSASVLFTLKELMAEPSGGPVLLFSYGAGFSAFGLRGRFVHIGEAHDKEMVRGREVFIDR